MPSLKAPLRLSESGSLRTREKQDRRSYLPPSRDPFAVPVSGSLGVPQYQERADRSCGLGQTRSLASLPPENKLGVQ